jgi:DNA-directed RNA polymerase specialized sigma24 family protein
MSAPSTDRLQQLAALYIKHDAQLLSVVRRRVAAQPATAADACAHAWAELLAAEHIDLSVPWGPLAWLTTTAIRQAWRLNAIEWRATPLSHDDLDAIAAGRGDVPSSDELAALHDRLDLVEEIPERPRRFLLRLAMGYSYHEISRAEGVSWSTTSKQIARAKRILRELEDPKRGETPPLNA